MNARFPSSLSCTLLAILYSVLFCASTALAVNHNPTTQTGNPKKETEVTLDNGMFIEGRKDYIASIKINPGDYPELLNSANMGGPDKLKLAIKDAKNVDIKFKKTGAQNVDASTSYALVDSDVGTKANPITITFTIRREATQSCTIVFVLSGLTGGEARTEEVSLADPPPESPKNSISSYHPLGLNASGGNAGHLMIYGNQPTDALYQPVGLSVVITDSSVEVIRTGTPSVVRQILSATQLTDVVSLSSASYEIRFYEASKKGSKVGGLYQPVGLPFKKALIENPGVAAIAGTEDDLLYASSRWGNQFGYQLPVADGPYKVQLHFAELYHDTVGAAVFNVKAEGAIALTNYDVLAAAGSKNTARTEEIATIVRDGELTLDFSSVTYGAQVAAIKVLRDGAIAIAGTGDDTLYQSERTGNFSYALTMPNGSYSVVLHFSESAYNAAGKRVFNVSAEGSVVLANYDIYAQAVAANTARTETIPVTLSDGQLNLQFVGVTGEASLSAITVINTATSTVVAAINAGGPAYTASDSTEFSADADYSGGTARFPGQLVHAINAGGDVYTAGDGTVFESDRDYMGGYDYKGGFNRIRITRTDFAATRIYNYDWTTEPASGRFEECILTFPDNLKKEGKLEKWTQDRLSYTHAFTVRDSLGNLVSKTVETHEKFPFGVRKVREVIDPDGAALTTTWTYVEGSSNPADPKPDGYGEVKSMDRYDGYWEDYFYNSQGYLVKTVSRYLGATSRDEADNQVVTTSYSTVNPIETVITTIKGQEVSLTYQAEFDDIVNHEFERWTIAATQPGAAWDAASNLVSKTRTYTSSHPTEILQGQTKWTARLDGAMSFYGYASGTGTRTVTTDSGAPNVGLTAITAGTRTVAVTNDAGQQIEATTIDISSGLTLSTWEALTVDDLGRPTEISYGDGTVRAITYVGSAASCGTCSSAGNFLVESETDRNGVTMTYAYDALNRRIETERLGIKEQFVYDAADRVIETHRIGTDDSDIRTSKTVYDLAGRVIATHDALDADLENGTTTTYVYLTGGGLITTTTDPAATSGAVRGTRIETTYADGRLKEISGTAVSPVKYAYGTWTGTGVAGEWTQEIKVGESASETEWTKSYSDLAGRTVKMEYPDSATATMVYNTLGQLVRQTDPDGVQTLFAYNTEGEREVTAIDLDQDNVIDYTGTDRITQTTHDVYSRSGTIVSRSTTQVWATDSSNITTTVSVSEQDGYGNQTWQTDAAGAVNSSLIDRDSAGDWRVISSASDGSQQVQTYSDGLLVSTVQKNSAGGQVTKVEYAYDEHNRVETQTDARTGAVAYTYSNRDEILTTISNNGTETARYAYDALGNQLTITRPDASVTTNEYHLRNDQLKKVSGSLTYPVEYTYDPQGRMKTLTTWQNATTSAGAAVTTWNYDSQRGWLTQKLYADNTGPSYTYTDGGRLETRTWVRTVSGSPLVTTYGYNNAGDLSSTDYSDTTPDVAITYNRFGAQATVADGTGMRTYTYTNALRLEQEQLPSYYGSRILTRSYQGSGSGEVPGRTNGFEIGVSGDLDQDYTVVYGYDNAGRINGVTDPNAAFSYTYVANSHLLATRSVGAGTAISVYEPYRDVLASVENKIGSTTISKHAYAVNNLGQRTSVVQTGTQFTSAHNKYGYDSLGQVITAKRYATTNTSSTSSPVSAHHFTLDYDTIGNRISYQQDSTSYSYTANTLNQYASYTGPATYTPVQDADGNVTANPRPSDGFTYLYTWDAENRIIHSEPTAPLVGDRKLDVEYDSQGRMVRKVAYAYAGGGSWTFIEDLRFVYDGWNPVAVYRVTGGSTVTLFKTYTWGLDLSGSLQGAGGVGGLLSAREYTTNVGIYFFTYDGNGNVSEVINNFASVVAHYEYGPFGERLVATGSYAGSNPYQFSTKPRYGGLESYYYGYRHYSHLAGRWLSRDVIDENGGKNLYGFLSNSPVDRIDLLGMAPNVEFPEFSTFDVALDAAKRKLRSLQLDTINEKDRDGFSSREKFMKYTKNVLEIWIPAKLKDIPLGDRERVARELQRDYFGYEISVIVAEIKLKSKPTFWAMADYTDGNLRKVSPSGAYLKLVREYRKIDKFACIRMAIQLHNHPMESPPSDEDRGYMGGERYLMQAWGEYNQY